MIAYCYRDGMVSFCDSSPPEGAIELCRGPRGDVERAVRATTDEGQIEGLKASSSVADDQQQLLLYLETLKDEASRLVEVADLTQATLDAEAEEY